MKRINEFEQQLAEKINMLEQNDGYEMVSASDMSRFLSGDGTIHYTFTSVKLECEISAIYLGSRYYGNNKLKINLSLNFE